MVSHSKSDDKWNHVKGYGTTENNDVDAIETVADENSERNSRSPM